MIFSNFFLNKKYSYINALLALVFLARILVSFPAYEPVKNSIPGKGVLAANIIDTTLTSQTDTDIEKQDSPDGQFQGIFLVTCPDKVLISQDKKIFHTFRTSVHLQASYSAFLTSHFSTDI